MFCSTDSGAGEITCQDSGETKSCSSLIMCWCKDGSPGSDYCESQNMGDHSDKDECS
jgi:hypothetical protein